MKIAQGTLKDKFIVAYTFMGYSTLHISMKCYSWLYTFNWVVTEKEIMNNGQNNEGQMSCN